jgi:hypothetical protein
MFKRKERYYSRVENIIISKFFTGVVGMILLLMITMMMVAVVMGFLPWHALYTGT